MMWNELRKDWDERCEGREGRGMQGHYCKYLLRLEKELITKGLGKYWANSF